MGSSVKCKESVSNNLIKRTPSLKTQQSLHLLLSSIDQASRLDSNQQHTVVSYLFEIHIITLPRQNKKSVLQEITTRNKVLIRF